MLKIRIAANIKCVRHPRFDPARDGEAGIKGGCGGCTLLLGIHRWLALAVTGQFEKYARDPQLTFTRAR